MTPTIGETYVVNHSRKGTFEGKLMAINGEWYVFEITNGMAEAILHHNIKYEGELVTCRESFFTLTPLDQE